jgi:hypothetical protein
LLYSGYRSPIIRELGIPSDRSDQVILGDRLLVEDSVCGENARTFGLDNQFESKKAAEWVVTLSSRGKTTAEYAAEWVVTLSSRGKTTAEYVIIFNYDDYDDCP